jgi:hypothetical protein
MLNQRFYFVAFLIAASALTCRAYPVVNEVLASNQAVLEDPEGEFDDWLELYNPEGVDLDLRGYFFSDDPEEPTQWKITGDEAVMVPAGGYVLLWLDGDPRSGQKSSSNLKLGMKTTMTGVFHFSGCLLIPIGFCMLPIATKL